MVIAMVHALEDVLLVASQQMLEITASFRQSSGNMVLHVREHFKTLVLVNFNNCSRNVLLELLDCPYFIVTDLSLQHASNGVTQDSMAIVFWR